MLAIRPNCELCDIDLPADSLEAKICTYKCTFCANCVEQVLQKVCPNCGGGLCDHPIRPLQARRMGVSRNDQAPSTERIHTKLSTQEISKFTENTKNIAPNKR